MHPTPVSTMHPVEPGAAAVRFAITDLSVQAPVPAVTLLVIAALQH